MNKGGALLGKEGRRSWEENVGTGNGKPIRGGSFETMEKKISGHV